jgi:hypothetical protein
VRIICHQFIIDKIWEFYFGDEKCVNPIFGRMRHTSTERLKKSAQAQDQFRKEVISDKLWF